MKCGFRYAAFHQDLHCLLGLKIICFCSLIWKFLALTSLICTMKHLSLTVANQVEEFDSIHRFKYFQRKIVNIFLPIIFGICFACSKEPSH